MCALAVGIIMSSRITYPFCEVVSVECFLVALHAVYVHVIAMTTITAISMAMITPIAIAMLLATLLSVFIVSIDTIVNVIQRHQIFARPFMN